MYESGITILVMNESAHGLMSNNENYAYLITELLSYIIFPKIYSSIKARMCTLPNSLFISKL